MKVKDYFDILREYRKKVNDAESLPTFEERILALASIPSLTPQLMELEDSKGNKLLIKK